MAASGTGVLPALTQPLTLDGVAEEIFAWAREKLAPYEVHRFIAFRTELPLTAVGKIDKKVLRKAARG